MGVADTLVGADGGRWLDLCAGPGGKTALLGALAAQCGADVTAVELNPRRAELVEHFGEEIASVVMEVTDDKSLLKAERKAAQVEHAPSLSRAAKLVKLADKISNLRDILASPPADWPNQRKLQYFEWAGRVVDGLRGVHPALEAEFDRIAATGRSRFSAAEP